MDINQYLQVIRKELHYTQEEMVTKLYTFHEVFEGLDTTTYSRWERSKSTPPINKQVQFLYFVYEEFKVIFPFINFEESILSQDLKKTTHKQAILGFPCSEEEEFYISSVLDSPYQNASINIALHLFGVLTQKEHGLNKKCIEKWYQNENNFTLIASFQKQFFGHLSLLSLNKKAFMDMMNFEKEHHDLKDSDFCKEGESQYYLIFSHFSMNDSLSQKLFLQLYKHLFQNQSFVKEIGVVLAKEDGMKMAERMNLKLYKDMNETLFSYRQTLEHFFINDNLIKIIFR